MPPISSKFNNSVEKKIGKLWLNAKDLNWTYSEFTAFALEIVTILHYRNSVDPSKKAGNKNEKTR